MNSSAIEIHGIMPEAVLETITIELGETLERLKTSLTPVVYFDSQPVRRGNAKTILILQEPPSVMPELYSKRILRSVDLVIIMSPWRAEAWNCSEWVFQPIKIPEMRSNLSLGQRVALINDHKFSSSTTSLYGLRRKILKRASKCGLPIDLFGNNWNMPRKIEVQKRLAALRRTLSIPRLLNFSETVSNFAFDYGTLYQGWSRDKLETLQKYRYSLVIENDITALSEKLFDCLAAGSIPIYIGPNLRRFTDLGPFVLQIPSDEKGAIKALLRILDTREVPSERINNERHFRSLTAPFSEVEVGKILARKIGNFLTGRLKQKKI